MIIHQNEGNELGAAAVKSIVNTFQEDLTMSVFATKNLIDPTILEQEAGMGLGETESIGQNESTSSREYYTIGMAVMTVLYLATAIGSLAFREKPSHALTRAILSSDTRW